MFKMKLALFMLFISLYSMPNFANMLITIASGEKTGQNYPIAGLICRMINKNTTRHHISCTALETQGKQSNIHSLINGEAQFAIVPSNTQYNAFNGLANFAEKGAYNDLRSVFSLYRVDFNYIVRKNSPIANIGHLRGKSINLGKKGSSEREMMEKMIALHGWTRRNFKRVFEFTLQEQISALCNNTLDMMIFASSHPTKIINQIDEECKIRFLEIDKALTQKMVQKNPFYLHSTLSKQFYSLLKNSLEGIAMDVTVVTSANIPEDVVYNFTKAVIEQIDKLRASHPLLAELQINQMTTRGLFAPLHSGAQQYFLEVEKR